MNRNFGLIIKLIQKRRKDSQNILLLLNLGPINTTENILIIVGRINESILLLIPFKLINKSTIISQRKRNNK